MSPIQINAESEAIRRRIGATQAARMHAWEKLGESIKGLSQDWIVCVVNVMKTKTSNYFVEGWLKTEKKGLFGSSLEELKVRFVMLLGSGDENIALSLVVCGDYVLSGAVEKAWFDTEANCEQLSEDGLAAQAFTIHIAPTYIKPWK